MTNERPLLLLSNDDGVNAKGIRELVGALRPVADLIVVRAAFRFIGSHYFRTSSPLCKGTPGARTDRLQVFGKPCRLCKTGFTCFGAPQARYGDRRYQSRRQFVGKCALFRYDGCGDRRLLEGDSFGRILIVQP